MNKTRSMLFFLLLINSTSYIHTMLNPFITYLFPDYTVDSLRTAILRGNVKVVRNIINSDVELNKENMAKHMTFASNDKDWLKVTPLIFASYLPNIDAKIIEFILEKTDLDILFIKDCSSYDRSYHLNAFQIAKRNNRDDIAMLIESAKDIKIKDFQDTISKNLNPKKQIFKNRMILGLKDENGNNALHIAFKNNNLKLAILIISINNKTRDLITEENNAGEVPFACNVGGNYPFIAKFLESILSDNDINKSTPQTLNKLLSYAEQLNIN